MELYDWILVLTRVVGAFVLCLTIVIFLVWAERKIVADMQDRLGPMRAGPYGILQTVADGLKLFFKEQVTPRKAELGAYLLAPGIAVVTAFLMFLVIPIARPLEVTIGGVPRLIEFQAMDLNIGLLYILAVSSMAVYAVVLAGWSSGSKYPLLGGVRATAQAISYEAAMGLALVAVVMYASSVSIAEGNDALSLASLVGLQQGTMEGVLGGRLDFLLRFIPRWNVIPQFIPFVIFSIAVIAETNRAPFDLVEAEQEIVGGFHTEYSGMRFAMFFLAEYVNMFTMSAVVVSVFLGGYSGLVFGLTGIWATLLSFGWFMAKVALVLFFFIWIRASLPRMRYDQLMHLGWKRLIPAALAWLVVSTLALAFRQFGPPWS